MTFRDRLALAPLALFGLAAIGAKDCTGWGWSNNDSDGYASAASGNPGCGQGGMGTGSQGMGASGAGGAYETGAGGGDPGDPTPQGLTCGSGSTGAFGGIDPQTLNGDVLFASAVAYYMTGEVSSSSTVPSTQAALEALIAQDAASADTAVTSWFMSIDPSTFPAAGVVAKYECTDELKCPYRTTCVNGGSWSQNEAPYTCLVVNCGDAKCTRCPSWFPPLLKSLTFNSWCSYVCIGQNASPPPVVAVGAIGVKDGKPFPSQTSAWCFPPS